MSHLPVIIATWQYGANACTAAWGLLTGGGSSLDAVALAAAAVEDDPEVLSVGSGGLPNAEGVIELDAAIMDGRTHGAGAVAGLTGIRNPIYVARRVMEATPHVMLVGGNARRFALAQGFKVEELHTETSRRHYTEWLGDRTTAEVAHFTPAAGSDSHDTVGICAVDLHGDLSAACTTSGMAWKVPGRVGDSPIIGAGLYVDNEVGAASATGNGDEMMKACLSYRIIMLMETGMEPQEACEETIRYLLRKRPGKQGSGASVIAVRKDGVCGNAATADGFRRPDRLWHYAVRNPQGLEVNEGVYVRLGT